MDVRSEIIKRLMPYPELVEIGNREYKINTDFLLWIEIERLLWDREMPAYKKLVKILALAYPVLPPTPTDALEKVIWFLCMGEVGQGEEQKGAFAKAFDLREDFEYIRAGFLEQFGIELLETKMHWWQFRRLLTCLDGESRFAQIVTYRTTDTGKIKNREARAFFEKMKKRYRLSSAQTPEAKETETVNGLENLFL